jgi:hypothetical protein
MDPFSSEHGQQNRKFLLLPSHPVQAFSLVCELSLDIGRVYLEQERSMADAISLMCRQSYDTTPSFGVHGDQFLGRSDQPWGTGDLRDSDEGAGGQTSCEKEG